MSEQTSCRLHAYSVYFSVEHCAHTLTLFLVSQESEHLRSAYDPAGGRVRQIVRRAAEHS